MSARRCGPSDGGRAHDREPQGRFWLVGLSYAAGKVKLEACPNGHKYIPGGFRIVQRSRGAYRQCLECHAIQIEKDRKLRRDYYWRNKARMNQTSNAWNNANKKRKSAISRLAYIQAKDDPSEGEVEQAKEIITKYPKRRVEELV